MVRLIKAETADLWCLALLGGDWQSAGYRLGINIKMEGFINNDIKNNFLLN